jgi:hypothetical protein
VKTFEIGPGLKCDVDRLVASRLLVQANSGGGKTRTLRRLLEQSHGRLQHLVIDPEGEYHTLREKFDYVLAAPSGGDTVAHPRTAAMLAERLLQLGVSAILDVYELNPDQRVLFVQRFLNAIVNAPRESWHPALIVLDEAHVYAPEGRENESAAAVKALASRGRKRGFCLVPATQRLAKLSKDVAAECNNKLIGRCTLDVDIKRAAEELGFTTNEQKQGLRQLEPGQFYAYGPAFDVKAPVLVHVGPVKSHHPEPGQKAAPVPAPTEKVKKVLQQLADLPAEAEEREKSIKELRADVITKDRRIKELQRIVELSNSGEKQEVKQVHALTDADRARIEKLTNALRLRLEDAGSQMRTLQARLQLAVTDAAHEYFSDNLDVVRKATADVEGVLEKPSVKKLLEKLNGLAVQQPARAAVSRQSVAPSAAQSRQVAPSKTAFAPRTPSAGDSNGEVKLNRLAERKLLQVLSQFKSRTVQQAAILTGYAASGGGFNGAISKLKSAGYLVSDRGVLAITDAGREAIGPVEPLPTGDALVAHWMQQFNRLAEREVLRVVVEAYPDALSAVDVASRTNPPYEPKGGGFNGAVSKLRTLGLIQGRGELRASDDLFLEGR